MYPFESMALTRSQRCFGTMIGNRLRSPVALRIEVSDAIAAMRTRSPAGRRSEQRQERDDAEGRASDDVVEDDQPNPAVAVEQRAGDGADEDPRQDVGEGDQTCQRRRVVFIEREQDDCHADHRAGDAGHDHRREDAAQLRDAEKAPIGLVDAGRLGSHGSRNPTGECPSDPNAG